MGTPGHMRLPHRLQGQKVKGQGGAGAYCGGDLAAQLVIIIIIIIIIICRTDIHTISIYSLINHYYTIVLHKLLTLL